MLPRGNRSCRVMSVHAHDALEQLRVKTGEVARLRGDSDSAKRTMRFDGPKMMRGGEETMACDASEMKCASG